MVQGSHSPTTRGRRSDIASDLRPRSLCYRRSLPVDDEGIELSVYPAGVRQAFRSSLTAEDGTVTLIDHPCVIKHISASPYCAYQIAFSESSSLILKVYDGTDILMAVAGSANANYLCTNSSIGIPADGLKVKNYLAIECFRYNSIGTDAQNKYANVSVIYQ